MIFDKNEEKIVAYCIPTLLEDVNLFIITAFMALIVKFGIPLIWDLILGHF